MTERSGNDSAVFCYNNFMVKSFYSSLLKNPSNVSFCGADKGEEVILLLRRHVITNVPWILSGICMFFLPTFVSFMIKFGQITLFDFLPLNYRLVLLAFWYLLSLTVFFENYLIWFFNVYLVTNKRLVDVDFLGVLNINVTDAPMKNVQDVTYKVSGVAQTLFHFGDVKVQTAGERREVEFELVPSPEFVQDVISDLASGVRGGKNVTV